MSFGLILSRRVLKTISFLNQSINLNETGSISQFVIQSVNRLIYRCI